MQVLPSQRVAPCGFVQAALQPPQCAVVMVVSVSQPLRAFWSQSPKPISQVGEHARATHRVEPCAF